MDFYRELISLFSRVEKLEGFDSMEFRQQRVVFGELILIVIEKIIFVELW